MPFLNWQKRTVRWTPDSYTANSVEAIMNVEAGDVVGMVLARTVVAFDGSATAAIVELGYGDNVDEFIDGGELEETSTSAATSFIIGAGASDGTYDTKRAFLFTAADTIDVNFTAATGGDGTAGEVEFTVYIAKVRP